MKKRAKEISEWMFEARGGEYWGEIFPHPDPERPETWEAWFQEMETVGEGRIFREASIRLRDKTMEERHFDNEAARRYASEYTPVFPMTLQSRSGLYLRLISFFMRVSISPLRKRKSRMALQRP